MSNPPRSAFDRSSPVAADRPCQAPGNHPTARIRIFLPKGALSVEELSRVVEISGESETTTWQLTDIHGAKEVRWTTKIAFACCGLL
jgi:hypothetical protein